MTVKTCVSTQSTRKGGERHIYGTCGAYEPRRVAGSRAVACVTSVREIPPNAQRQAHWRPLPSK